MSRAVRLSTLLRWTLVATTLVLATPLTGCGPSASDLAHWATEDGGPEKLAHAVANEKVSIPIRRDAALALTRLTRRHRKVGLDLLLDALAASKPASREQIVKSAGEDLVAKMKAPRPTEGPDPTIDAKDATYAFLARGLTTDAAEKKILEDALTEWLSASTIARLDDDSQRYSGEQALRLVGARGARLLPPLLLTASKTKRLAKLIAELGDAETKQHATDALIALVKSAGSPENRAQIRRDIEDMSAKNKMAMTRDQIDHAVSARRKVEISDAFDAIREIGLAPGFLLDFAADGSENSDVRVVALGSLKGHEQDIDAAVLDKLFALVQNETTPDEVLDAAYDRLLVLERTARDPAFDARVAAGIRVLAQSDRWETRIVGKSLILAQLPKDGVDGFMRALPTRKALSLLEVLTYGAALEKRVGRNAVRPYLAGRPPAPRMVALAAFIDDAPTLAQYEDDPAKIATCPSCGWSCAAVPVDTVGRYVRSCLEPPPTTHVHSTVDLGIQADEMLKALGQQH